LVVRAIEQAQASRTVNEIVVSTDDAEIAALSERAGAEIVWRPSELAMDRTPTVAVLTHVVQSRRPNAMPDRVVTLQPTSPLRLPRHIDEAIALLTPEFDAVVSVCPVGHSPYKMFSVVGDALRPLMEGAPPPGAARQDLPLVYQENGAVYVTWTRVLREQNSIWGKRTRPFLMDIESSVDIDTAVDLIMAEAILSTRKGSEENDGRDSTN
jgi:N-acylneuraminate cytidylyltransferase/CMP-N,N'-diacetyllegionaminic acid synthase